MSDFPLNRALYIYLIFANGNIMYIVCIVIYGNVGCRISKGGIQYFFGKKKSMSSKEIIVFFELTSCQKLGIICENKRSQKLKLQNILRKNVLLNWYASMTKIQKNPKIYLILYSINEKLWNSTTHINIRNLYCRVVNNPVSFSFVVSVYLVNR